MDVQIFDKDSLRIKFKKASLAIDPKPKVAKFDADATLILDKTSDPSRVNNSRVLIKNVGEYEVGGLKISGMKSQNDIMYGLNFENVFAIVARASSLEKLPTDKIGEYQIAIINVDSDLDQTVVTAMEPRVVILYGEKAKEGAKLLGKADTSTASKISFSEEKLPEEMDVMLLA